MECAKRHFLNRPQLIQKIEDPLDAYWAARAILCTLCASATNLGSHICDFRLAV